MLVHRDIRSEKNRKGLDTWRKPRLAGEIEESRDGGAEDVSIQDSGAMALAGEGEGEVHCVSSVNIRNAVAVYEADLLSLTSPLPPLLTTLQ